MGAAKALVREKTRIALEERTSPFNEPVGNTKFKKVFNVLEKARASKPNAPVKDIKCPLCGKMTAYVTPREFNEDLAVVAACSRGCFYCVE